MDGRTGLWKYSLTSASTALNLAAEADALRIARPPDLRLRLSRAVHQDLAGLVNLLGPRHTHAAHRRNAGVRLPDAARSRSGRRRNAGVFANRLLDLLHRRHRLELPRTSGRWTGRKRWCPGRCRLIGEPSSSRASRSPAKRRVPGRLSVQVLRNIITDERAREHGQANENHTNEIEISKIQYA